MMYEAAKQQLLNCKASIPELKDFDLGFGKVWAASCFRTGQTPCSKSDEYHLPTNYDKYIYHRRPYVEPVPIAQKL
ncbi:hypothetical protein N7455_012607 [Penicillium solitum]|uniref:uncharacterized protein n=1 Tax=Penicillium solitum TaxID=60172 RepID=UPI0032C3DA30|nr:hypothetical protein N7455_012607 [Penicillium solitum]